MMGGRVLALMVVVASVLSSCASDDGPGADEARLTVSGSVTVTDAEGGSETTTGTTTLDFGDTVVVDDGTAVVELAGGQRYELRSGPEPSQLMIGAPPTLVSGDALVSDGFPAQLRFESSTVSAQGAMKLSSAVPAVTSYAGRARIDGAGSLDEVLGLRRVVLTSSAVAEPLTYDGSDAWDRRFLSETVAFGDRLEALARGYTADLGPGGGRSVSFFEAVVPALGEQREFGADLLTDRPVGETLVGAAIVVQGRDGTFRERWDEVFAFRDLGAAWGIVALDQGVSSAPLLDTVELAVASPTPTEPPSTTTSGPSTTPPSPTTVDSPTTTGTTTTSVPEEPSPPPPPPGLLDPLDPLLDPVSEILGELLGALGLG